MATVRRNPRGRGWQLRYRDVNGKQRTEVFETKSQADGRCRDLESDLRRNTWIDPALGKTTFGEYAVTWRQSVAHLRPGSLNNLDCRMRRHVLPAFENAQLREIQPSDVRTWVASLVGLGLAPASVTPIYRLFARIMSTAVVDGLIVRSPCIGVRLPREPSKLEMHFLSPEEVTALANSIAPRYRALVYTAAYTGMRWGELMGLRVQRCNLLRGSIDVVESLTEINGRIQVGPTKTGKTRTISLPQFLRDLLAEHMTSYGTPGGFVFTSSQGLPIRRNLYRRHFKPAVLNAGLPPGLRFHDLRHTCVAMLIAQGAHPKEIQERLGHSTIKLTFDRYGHLLPTLDDRLRDGLDELWLKSQSNDATALKPVPIQGGITDIKAGAV